MQEAHYSVRADLSEEQVDELIEVMPQHWGALCSSNADAWDKLRRQEKGETYYMTRASRRHQVPTDHSDVCADLCEGQTYMLTREEREAIHGMPVNVLNLNKWENEAWNAIRHLHLGCKPTPTPTFGIPH